MAVSFPDIPQTLRLPLFHANLDPSRAGVFSPYGRAVVLGYRLSSGSAPALTLTRVASDMQGLEAAGAGSHGSDALNAWFANNQFDEAWFLPLPEPASGTAATGTVTVTGPATASGQIVLYIAGRPVLCGVITGDSASQIATKLAAAINADTRCVVTASVAAAVVTLTVRWKGEDGNGVDVRHSYRGASGGEALPAGVGLTIAALSGGVGVPDIAAALAALGDWKFYTMVCPWTDSSTLDAIDAFMDHRGDVGRWSWAKQLYGRVYTFRAGTAGQLQTFGNGRNGPHIICPGYRGSPTPPWRAAAMYAAQAHRALLTDPARPLHTLPMVGFLPAPQAQQFTAGEQNALSYDGISVLGDSPDGTVMIKTSITMYQRNAFGSDDNAMLKVQTLATMQYLLENMRHRIESKYPRHKLGNDGTRYGAGQAIVTPKTARAEIVALYRQWENLALVENADAFEAHLIVERDPQNENRLNVLFPPDLINQLDVFAVLAQFRLQYPDQLPDRPLDVAA